MGFDSNWKDGRGSEAQLITSKMTVWRIIDIFDKEVYSSRELLDCTQFSSICLHKNVFVMFWTSFAVPRNNQQMLEFNMRSRQKGRLCAGGVFKTDFLKEKCYFDSKFAELNWVQLMISHHTAYTVFRVIMSLLLLIFQLALALGYGQVITSIWNCGMHLLVLFG